MSEKSGTMTRRKFLKSTGVGLALTLADHPIFSQPRGSMILS